MMIGPEGYYEFHLKGKSADEIRSAIRGLKQNIGRKKNSLENPIPRGVEPCILPSEETQIYYERLYLQRAIQALEELGEKYVPSQKEQKALEFDTRIENIKEIVFCIGSWCEIKRDTIVRLEDGKANFYECILDTERKIAPPYPMDKDEFCEQLRDLYIGEWNRHYSCDKYGWYILDGTQWGLRIKYADDTKDKVFGGNNCYPYNFSKLLELLGRSDDE